MKIVIVFMTMLSFGFSLNQCPYNITSSGWVKDLAIASDMVSSEAVEFDGTCGRYKTLKTCDMDYPYYTRMRIYEKINSNINLIIFRPTQPNSQIHTNKYMTECIFLDSIQDCGKVHNHFQEAFIFMENECTDILHNIKENKILIGGHSLGNSFDLFMAAKLYFDYQVTPIASIGFAGPFIGDWEYTQKVQDIIKTQFEIKQIEVADKDNLENRDKTVEVYNTDDNGIYVDDNLLCYISVIPLPIDPNRSYDPHYSYGMHDLKNYILSLDDANLCETK